MGHALGIGNSTDPNSPMLENYSGVRTGLTADDISAVRSLYGSGRGTGSKTTTPFSAAKEVKAPAGSPANASPVILADLTTAQDVDYFKFRAGATGTLTVRVDASSSLLAARLTVYDAAGNVVGTAAGTPLGGPIQVHLTGVEAGAFTPPRSRPPT